MFGLLVWHQSGSIIVNVLFFKVHKSTLYWQHFPHSDDTICGRYGGNFLFMFVTYSMLVYSRCIPIYVFIITQIRYFEPIEGYECKELTHIHKLYILNVIFSICGLCGNRTQKPTIKHWTPTERLEQQWLHPNNIPISKIHWKYVCAYWEKLFHCNCLSKPKIKTKRGLCTKEFRISLSLPLCAFQPSYLCLFLLDF